MASIPRPTAPIADMVGGRILVNREWFDYFRLRAESGDLTAINKELADLRKQIDDIDTTTAGSIKGTQNIRVTGQLSDGLVQIDLAELPDQGGGELLNILRDSFGRVVGTSSAEAPEDGKQYARKDGDWAELEAGVSNLDGGRANSIYGGTVAINGGGA